jgi:hypothetical protein
MHELPEPIDPDMLGALSDAELREELLIAAMARGRRRIDRYRRLLAEWRERLAAEHGSQEPLGGTAS